MLVKVISGGQTGADQAGLAVAKRFGLMTGGMIPKGFRTLVGPRPDLGERYGLLEHTSDNYVPRTQQNVRHSDATVRFAGNFRSPGEICTLKAITKFGKPYFDVDLADPVPVQSFLDWLASEKVGVLNVAGNAEETYKGAFTQTAKFLTAAFFRLGLPMAVTAAELLAGLGLPPGDFALEVPTPDGKPYHATEFLVKGVSRER